MDEFQLDKSEEEIALIVDICGKVYSSLFQGSMFCQKRQNSGLI